MIARFYYVFSFWLYFWYILFELKITKYNPKFGLQIAVFVEDSLDNKFDTYVFNGINDIIDDFINFYDIFSPYCDAYEKLTNLLDNKNNNIREQPQYAGKVSNTVYKYDARINRNPIDIYVKDIIKNFFSDLTSENNIQYLQECYCSSENTEKHE